MTTIAYKDGILAVDTQLVCNGTKVGEAVKYKDTGDFIIAFSGEYQDFENATHNIENQTEPKKLSECGALIIDRMGTVYQMNNNGLMYKYHDKFYALGSGMDIAYGAMEAGASAEEAVKIACLRDISTGGKVAVLNVKKIFNNKGV